MVFRVNFLAHCALASDAAAILHADVLDGLLAGAIIADFSKGKIPSDWPTSVAAGVRLHRRIDSATNQLPAIKVSCNRFPKHLRRLAPIFIDILGDYHLSQTWSDYYTAELDEFSKHCYAAVRRHSDLLPERGQRFITYLEHVDLLANGADWANIENAIASVLRRLRSDLSLSETAATVYNLAAATRQEFDAYYPECIQLARAWGTDYAASIDAISAAPNTADETH